MPNPESSALYTSLSLTKALDKASSTVFVEPSQRVLYRVQATWMFSRLFVFFVSYSSKYPIFPSAVFFFCINLPHERTRE